MSDPWNTTPQSSLGERSAAIVDAGLKAHMLSVYNRMAAGLAITSVVAYIASNSPAMLGILQSPLGIVLALAPLAVIWFGFNPMTMSSQKLRASFILLSVLYGLSFATIFLAYVPADITRALLMTTAMFAGLSIFGYTTKRDLKPIAVFCVMAMWGLLAFSLIYMIGASFSAFPVSVGVNNMISIATILIFSGLTAWETQATKEMYHAGNGAETNSRMAWAAALNLYISFIAIFQSLLQLMSQNRN